MPDRLVVRALTDADSQDIAGWRYSGPWQRYDQRPEDGLLEAYDGYHAVVGDPGGELVGFLCIGEEARVPGISEEPDVVDVGVGMHPELVGQGYGARFGEAVLEHLRTGGASRARAVVQSWNERSIRAARRMGFVETARHVCRQDGRDVEYVVLGMELRPSCS
jgi:[ribosomal protein S18]-alanine N-acetyltransferase